MCEKMVINFMKVVAALIWDNDKFMICQRPAHKARALLWEFVGGKVEAGETKEPGGGISPGRGGAAYAELYRTVPESNRRRN